MVAIKAIQIPFSRIVFFHFNDCFCLLMHQGASSVLKHCFCCEGDEKVAGGVRPVGDVAAEGCSDR